MKPTRWIAATLLALTLAAPGASAWAADSTMDRVGRKAVRGLDNTLFGLIADWPKTVYYQSQEHGLAYGLTVGAVQGVTVGLARTGVGAYELATSPFPYPSDYRPILAPEFSLEPAETRLAR